MAASDYAILDPRFGPLINPTANLDKLWTGSRWAEGPAYLPAMRQLIWSDIPNDRMLRYDEASGHVSVFRQAAGFANGNAIDRQGRLVTCEHGGRRVSRTEHDGSITTIAEAWRGKRLNSPNDVVVAADGAVWFSDPPYGILSDYEGYRAESEIGANHLYRVDPQSGAVAVAADDFDKPNGLAFSPDGARLYVADTGASHTPGGPRHIRVFDVGDNGALRGGRLFADCTAGFFDGFRVDTAGRIWTSAGDGVHCYDPDGTLIGKVLVPEIVANVVFGGPRRNRLYICGTTSLYAIYLCVNGARTF